ncbi:hypothetical protein ACLKA6_003532 [Drosophila palustris]
MELPRTTSTTAAGNGVGDKLKLNQKQKQEQEQEQALESCCTGVASVGQCKDSPQPQDSSYSSSSCLSPPSPATDSDSPQT